uniref:Strictosidine synthase n=1 Tax=Mitragyna speciosa TaxID=170351 RepID=A0AAT9UTV8_9GENT|nr:strictosidine synthase [Mitragyna speciosa]
MNTSESMVALTIFFTLFLFPLSVVLSSAEFFQFLKSPYGPNAFAFNSAGELYAAVEDGRIVKYKGSSNHGFSTHAVASPFWNRKVCENYTELQLKPFCGRTYDLGFHHETRQLYIADCYYGLGVVGPEGGRATQVARSADGVDFKWLYALAVDQQTGFVYLTDVSTKYDDRGVQDIMRINDTTGRLIKYDPSTNEARVLMNGLNVPGGTEVSKDGSFLVVAEFLSHRILKYWLKGPKANTSEVLLKVRGPGNIKRTKAGEFWVASSDNNGITVTPRAIKFDDFGNILQVVPVPPPHKGEHFEQAQEHNGALYIGTLFHDFVGILHNNEGSSEPKENNAHGVSGSLNGVASPV